jgi:hypothetical protein
MPLHQQTTSRGPSACAADTAVCEPKSYAAVQYTQLVVPPGGEGGYVYVFSVCVSMHLCQCTTPSLAILHLIPVGHVLLSSSGQQWAICMCRHSHAWRQVREEGGMWAIRQSDQAV